MSSPKHMKVKIYSLGQLLESYFNDFFDKNYNLNHYCDIKKKYCCCLPYLIARKRNTASFPKITQGLIFFSFVIRYVCNMTLLNLALYMTYQTGKKGNNIGESDKHNSFKSFKI